MPGLRPFRNGTSALPSGLERALPFFAAAQASSDAAAAGGAALQFLFSAALSGLSGAALERLRGFRPSWAACRIHLVAVPVCLHPIEWPMHQTLAPGSRRAGILVSRGQSALSIATQGTLLREGLCLAGAEARNCLDD